MKLYGSKVSVCTQRVLVVLSETHATFDFIPVALPTQEQKVCWSTIGITDI